ncbi:MAG: stage II sporulation protein M [archaeon]|nr:MAG: stage II sporulation protein M [archaeon]
MLEGIWLREEYKNNLLVIFFFALAFTIIGVYLTNYILPISQGLVAVFLVSLIGAYPLIAYLRSEEKEEMVKRLSEKKLLERHANELAVYMAFFLGVTFGFLICDFVFPQSFFAVQVQIIEGIRGSTLSANATGNLVLSSLFERIITNNLWVFFLTFVVSFLFSAGMVFVLVWNASVLGVFIARASGGVTQVHVLALSYLPHGLLEIAAYILAGISGALLSYQFGYYYQTKSYKKDAFIRVMKDSMVLISGGLICLLLAGIIEVL